MSRATSDVEEPGWGALGGRWLRRLLARRPRFESRPPEMPPGVRLYAIGDIHGRVDLLRRLHEAILADAAAHPGAELQIVYLGDYVDRGLHSREVVDLLLDEPLPGFTSIHLCGNHDQQFLQFLRDPESAVAWLRYGGDATIFSYGVRLTREAPPDERIHALWTELRKAVPPRHVEFLRRLQRRYEIGDYLFAHAGVDPDKPLDRQTDRDLLWIRDAFLEFDGDFGKIVVHGHSMSDGPDVRENRIGIDTGACYTNRLTCLILEGQTQAFLSTGDGARPGVRAGG